MSPRNADQLHDVLRLRGDLRPGQYDPALAEPLLDERRAITAAHRRRGAARRRRGRRALPRRARRDASGRPARGVPRGRATDALESLVARFAKGRGPFTTAEANEHFGIDVEPVLRELEREERLVRGELRPGGASASGATRTSCAGCVARRWPRSARRSSPPSRRRSAGSCRAGTGSTGARAFARRSCRSRRLRFRFRLWESEVLPRRVPNYQPAWLDQLCATGELVWVGAGLDRVAVYFREDAPRWGGSRRRAARGRDTRPAARGARQGAEFWFDLLAAAGLEAEQALPALWDLVWAGEVTNDAWTPLRAGRRYGVPRPERRPRRFSRRRSTGITATQGRWSLTDRLFPGGRRTAVRSPSCCSSGRGS